MSELVLPFGSVVFWVVLTAVLFFLLGSIYSSSKYDGDLTYYPSSTYGYKNSSRIPYSVNLDVTPRELKHSRYLVLRVQPGWVEHEGVNTAPADAGNRQRRKAE